MADRSERLGIIVYVEDQASGKLTRVKAEVAGIGRAGVASGAQLGTLSKTMNKVGSDIGHGVRNAARNIERIGFAAAGLAVAGGAAAVKWAGDFQAGMQTINSVALATPQALDRAGQGLRSIFRETGQSMEDLQSAEYDLVSAGVKLQDSQTGVATAVKLGIGALGTTSQAVDVLTTAINSYNLKSKDGTIATSTWTRVSDELAQAVADGKVKLDEIAQSYAMVAPTAAQFGVKTGEVAAALGYLTAKGNPAAETLTQMNRAIIELAKPKGDMATVLKKLGTTGADLIKKNGLAGALQIIRDEADKLHIPFQNLFGRVEAYKFALQTTGPNAAGFAAELDRINHSAGMTNKQFDERAQGFNYQLGVLKANVQDAGITIGTALLPKLTEMAQKAADFLRGHQGDIQSFATELGDGFQRAATWAEGLDWPAIGSAIKDLAGFGKSLADGFMAMPAEAKEILLGLYGLNKLSGGAVVNVGVDLTKGIGGGLFQQFLGRGSIANPMWVRQVGGPGGGGPGGGNPIATAAEGAAGAEGVSAAEVALGLGSAAIAAAAVAAFYLIPPYLLNKNGTPTQINGQQGITITPGTRQGNMILAGNPNLTNLAIQAGISTTALKAPKDVHVSLASADAAMFKNADEALHTQIARGQDEDRRQGAEAAALARDQARILRGIEAKRESNRLFVTLNQSIYGHDVNATKAVVQTHRTSSGQYQFAEGGAYGPGIRIAGERGPELQVDGGRGYIFSTTQSRNLAALLERGVGAFFGGMAGSGRGAPMPDIRVPVTLINKISQGGLHRARVAFEAANAGAGAVFES